MKYRTPGFTLIELLIAMTIIVLVAALLVPRLQLRDSKTDVTRVQLRQIERALLAFRLDFGRFPTTAEGLRILAFPPADPKMAEKWKPGGYLTEFPQDRWKRDFVYRAPGHGGRDFDLISLGADGLPGGTGEAADISAWD